MNDLKPHYASLGDKKFPTKDTEYFLPFSKGVPSIQPIAYLNDPKVGQQQAQSKKKKSQVAVNINTLMDPAIILP